MNAGFIIYQCYERGKKAIKGYKGFNTDLTCRGFQYEVGKEYKCEKTDACKEGFHFCENPLVVLDYYYPSDRRGLNRFCKAEGCGDFDLSDDNIICSTKIKIKEEIGIEGLIEEGLDFIARKEKKHGKERNLFSRYVMSDTEEYSTTDNTEGYSVSANTGTYSAATNTGESSLAVNAGYYSVAKNKGNYSVAANTGDCSASVNMGFHSAATNKGISSVSLNMGAFSAAVNEGDFSVSLSTGVESSAVAKGKQSFAIAIGHESKAKGSLGSWIVLTECEEYNGEVYPVKEAKIFKVDGEKIKPDTYYKLVNGEAVEA